MRIIDYTKFYDTKRHGYYHRATLESGSELEGFKMFALLKGNKPVFCFNEDEIDEMVEERINEELEPVKIFGDKIPTAINNDKPIFTANDIILGSTIYQDNKHNTVLKIKDKIFKAKPEKSDKFDSEKGVMMCILKAMGITTSDLLDICNDIIKVDAGKKSNGRKETKRK